MKKRKPKVDVSPHATLTVVCVYNQKHQRTIDLSDGGQAEMPFCEIDGGPMIAAKAYVQASNKRRR